MLVGDRDTTTGPVAPGAPPVDSNSTAQGGPPFRAAAVCLGVEDAGSLTGRYQPIAQPRLDRVLTGIADPQESVIRAFGVLGHDAEDPFGRPAVAGVPLLPRR